MTTFQAIRVDGPDDADNEVDHDAWVKLKQLYDAFVGQTAAANKIPVWSSGTALTFEAFTAKAIALAACTTNAQVLAELGITTQGRNLFPNGDMRVSQRGAGPFTSASTFVNNDDSYLVDGIILLSDGNDIVDVSVSTTITPGGSVGGYASLALDVETANKKFGVFIPLEARDAARLIAGNAVMSFQGRRGTNATVLDMRAAIVSWQGTEDTITSDIVSAWGASGTNPTLAANWTYETTPQDLTLTTSFQKFDESDGLAGAIDTASTKNVGIFIWYNKTDATVADFVYLTDIQIEKGLVATDFAPVPYEFALAWARRRLRVLAPGNGKAIGQGLAITTTQALQFMPFDVPMAAAPTGITISAASHFDTRDGSNGAHACSGFAFSSATQEGILILATVASGLTAGQVSQLFTANASALLLISAEL